MRLRFRANLEIAGCPAFWEYRQFGAPSGIVMFRVGAAKLIGTNQWKRRVVPPATRPVVANWRYLSALSSNNAAPLQGMKLSHLPCLGGTGSDCE